MIILLFAKKATFDAFKQKNIYNKMLYNLFINKKRILYLHPFKFRKNKLEEISCIGH